MKTAVGSSSEMPKLEKNHAAFLMHGIDSVLPALGHLVRVDARRLVPSVCLFGNCRRLGDEQARFTSLGIVFSHQPIGNAVGSGP